MDEKKMRLYKFLLSQKKITIEQIPEPYKSSLIILEEKIK